MRNYLEGVSLDALARGHRVLLGPLKSRHASARADHVESLGAWKARQAKAREIKDPQQRAAALESLKGERPTHPVLVAAGAAVVSSVVLWSIPAVHRHAAALIAGGVTLWMIAAMIAGQKGDSVKAHAAAAVADEQGADSVDGDDQTERGAQLGSLRIGPSAAEAHALTASVAASGTSVLLTRLAADLTVLHPSWEPSTKAVRALLAEAGIPVRSGVRTPDGNGPGVHHRDVALLPLPLDGTPVPGVVANVAAGQEPTPTPTTPGPSVTQEGFILQADPENPARTLVGRYSH